MPRIDDYIQAKKLSAQTLAQQPFETILSRSGFESPAPNQFRIPFLNRVYQLRYPDFEFKDEADENKQIPLQEQVLILHYLLSEPPMRLSEKWVAYREIPGASFYYSAFVKRAIDPLKKVFGNNIAGLVKAAAQLKGTPIHAGTAGFQFDMLPHVPLQLIVWEGDEEFPSEANILFDATIGKILLPEDIAWLSGFLVYRLMALSR